MQEVRLDHTMLSASILIRYAAHAYVLASYLPSLLLDALLNLPATLMSIRNKYLPVAPRVPPTLSAGSEAVEEVQKVEREIQKAELEASIKKEPSAAPSMAASESDRTGTSEGETSATNAAASGVETSWISVQD